MEEEYLFLAEKWNLAYHSFMEIPWSRRQRLVDRKYSLEKQRAAAQEAEAARIRSQGRRRR